ncbi:MAG: hypothetical protein IKX33_00680 [Prevotella sp.]|nr:hypothetical protein [Prevotella sp.]
MRKNSTFKSLLLLCLLWVGMGSVSAQEQGQYAWHKVTNLSDVKSDDLVLLVDESKNIALPNDDASFTGVSVTISNYKIADDVSDNIQWTLTKNNDGSFTFKRSDGKPLYGDGTSGAERLTMISGSATTSEFYFTNYDSGGKLYYENQANFRPDYVYWDTNNQAGVTTIIANAANFTLYKRGVEKWKLVDGNAITLTDGDIVVVADLASGMAMSNDKADEDPDAVDIDTLFNDDKDRLVGEIPEKIKWIYNTATGGFQLSTTTTDEENQSQTTNYLYADSKGLKVGTETPNVFDIYSHTETDDQNNSTTTDYLHIKVSNKDYLAGVEESMFSNTWKLKEFKNNKPDNTVKNTRYAFFKRVVDNKKVITLKYKDTNYELTEEKFNTSISFTSPQSEGADIVDIIQYFTYTSSNDEIATVSNSGVHGAVRPLRMGMVKITVRLPETDDYDKATASYTIRLDDASKWGSRAKPFTPSQAKELAENGTLEISGEIVTLDPECCYYVEGVVNKVNSGMMSMFGDLGLDEMMGDDMDMDERMGDMDDFDMSEMGDMMGGMDFASMIPGFGSSEGLTYYISDDGTKDNRLKVVNGRGLAKNGTYANSVVFDELKDLSPGDEVLVYGPLVSSEDNNLFAGLMGGGDNSESKKKAKIDELNYLHKLDMTLLVQDTHTYTDYKKTLTQDQDFFYTLAEGKPAVGTPQTAQIKSADEEIAKWIVNEEKTDSVFTAINPGTTKITVKIKVIVVADDPGTDDNEEKSYTMKRKFQLEVLPRDKEPDGKNVGEYVLARDVTTFEEIADLQNEIRVLIVGTRTKDNNGEAETNHYALGKDASVMGGGKGGKNVNISTRESNGGQIEYIKFEDVPDNTQEIILEKEGGNWYLNVGKDENGNKLYLYASVKEASTEEPSDDPESTSGFNFDEMMEMFNPSSGLKVGTKEAVGDSCKATIAIDYNNHIATIAFPMTAGQNNTIMLTSSFDMESMMNMFGGNEEENNDDPNQESTEGTGMNFDFFMASFNTKKAEDADGEKAILPRIFVFRQYDEYPIEIGETNWKTIVSDYDVKPQDADLEVYVVTSVEAGSTIGRATLERVEYLKGGEPYLLHSPKGEYIMKKTFENVQKPEVNLLKVSDEETTGEKGNTTVYVLAKKTKGVGFYQWINGKLGSGRVYLSVPAEVSTGAGEFISFGEDTTEIETSLQERATQKASYFNLSGQRVNHPTKKGIYITDGKKVVIK